MSQLEPRHERKQKGLGHQPHNIVCDVVSPRPEKIAKTVFLIILAESAIMFLE